MSVIVQTRSQTATVAGTVTLTPSSPQACDLAARLAGRTIRLPNLKKHLVEWPNETSVHLPRARYLVDRMLEKITRSPRKLQGLKACDFGFLAASIFSATSFEKIEAAALFLVWIFVWDDEIDHGEGTNGISIDSDLARRYCDESLDYISWGLGLSGDDQKEPKCSIPNMPLFRDLSLFLREGMDLAQRESLYQEVKEFVDQVRIEQTGQQYGHIPTPDEYTRMRLGTSGITPGLAFGEYTSGVALPRDIMESPEMRTLWKEATSLCMMINDMYSMKKEVKSGALQNMIPVMINAQPNASLDAIMADFEALFAKSVASYDDAYRQLDERTQGDGRVNEDLRTYVRDCRRFVTGLLEWSLMTKRYGMKSCLQADGSALVCL